VPTRYLFPLPPADASPTRNERHCGGDPIHRIDRLAVSPQCGFASVDQGNPVTPAAQEAKLRLVVELAAEVWGAH